MHFMILLTKKFFPLNNLASKNLTQSFSLNVDSGAINPTWIYELDTYG